MYLSLFHWLRWCQSNGIASLRPLAYSEFIKDGARRAILITAGLDQHIPLTDIEMSEYRGQTSLRQRRILLKSIARAAAEMHAKKLQHRCLYSKHIFIPKDWQEVQKPDVRLIDLEKARELNWFETTFGEGVFRDLDSLNRHAQLWTRTERLYFLREYVDGDRDKLKQLAANLSQSMVDSMAES